MYCGALGEWLWDDAQGWRNIGSLQYLSPDAVLSLKAPTLPTQHCITTSSMMDKEYLSAGQAGAFLHTMAILQAF